jgi:hypothetical protein
MSEKWSMFTEHSGKRKGIDDGNSAAGKPAKMLKGSGQPTPITDGQPKPTPTTKGGKPKPIADKPPSPEADEKATLNKLIAEVTKLKVHLHSTSAAATNLAATIQSDKAWGWANTSHSLGQLQARLAAVHDSLSPFGKQILIGEISMLRKTVGTAFLLVELPKFISLKNKINDLATYHATLVRMHKDFTGVYTTSE